MFMKTDDYKNQRKNDTKQKEFILKKIKTGISSTFLEYISVSRLSTITKI